MASIIYNSCLEDSAKGAIDFDTDTFYVMLVGATYDAIADNTKKDSHTKRSDITDEISGTGYTAGGAACTCTVAKDTANDRVTLTFAATTWTTATITNANGAVYYKRRGGAATADELVAYNDFGGNYSSTAADFTVAASVITLQN